MNKKSMKITKPEIKILTINSLLNKLFVLFIYSDNLIYVRVGNLFINYFRLTGSSFLNLTVDINS